MTQSNLSLNVLPTVDLLFRNSIKLMGAILVAMLLIYVTDQKLQSLKNEVANAPGNLVSTEQRMKELDCLTRNIYWEAANEPFEGKVAVAQVTMNRVDSGRFSDSVCGVVYQKNVFYEKVVCQFSWYCEAYTKTRPIHPALWKESHEVAKQVLLEDFRLPSLQQALFYHADYINPGWKKQRIDQIGHHIFYRD